VRLFTAIVCIDRLPLIAVQWRLAILVTVTWGFIILPGWR
jgi:hypothetical protein